MIDEGVTEMKLRSLWQRFFGGVILALVMVQSVSGQVYSELWGKAGEKWVEGGRLPDFSFAGYHFGEDDLPVVEVVANVRDFGAVGDGVTDDTAAFKAAIAGTDGGAILVPAGRYLLSDILWIEKPNVVLRGAGMDATVLVFEKGMEAVRPNPSQTTSGIPVTNYSWSGGFLWVKGNFRAGLISAITSEAKRGERVIQVADASGLAVGQRVMVELTDDGEKTLLSHLYSGDTGDTKKVIKPVRPRMVSRITAIDGNVITLERGLRWNVRDKWSPVLKAFEPSVYEVGIEELAIEFPAVKYRGHFTEVGSNGIALNGVADCWVRNVKITNGDSGLYLAGMFCTAEGLVIDAARKATGGTTGHHGITMGIDCLVTEFDLRTHFIHDITLGYLAAGNVIKNGKGTNLSLDHHKKAPHDNLFCNVDLGKGSEMWRCGGGASLGKHCGARGTFWGIRARQDQKPERSDGRR